MQGAYLLGCRLSQVQVACIGKVGCGKFVCECIVARQVVMEQLQQLRLHCQVLVRQRQKKVAHLLLRKFRGRDQFNRLIATQSLCDRDTEKQKSGMLRGDQINLCVLPMSNPINAMYTNLQTYFRRW